MGLFDKILGGSAAAPIDAIGNAVDKIFTNQEEKMQAQAVMDKIRQHPGELQNELNKIEAGHRSLFVAGWRPAIGWICGGGLAFIFLINPIVQWISGNPGPDLPTESIMKLVWAMLGMGAMRTVEKLQGRTK